jgi:pimeloyl-ACP methyl ester carboxylesterase
MALHQHRRGDGQVQPHRPRIARCRSGDDSEAAVGIVRMAPLAQDSSHPIGQGGPLDADHGLPLRPPQHPCAGPLEGQHPSGQCNGQRREAATGRQPRQPPAREGVEAARAPRIGGVVGASGASEPALGPGVSRIARTACQRNEQIACLPGQLVGPHHPQPVHRPPAWKTLPCWYLLGTEDKAIPPALQRFMAERANATIVEVSASHVSFVSQPEAATQLILRAVEATAAARS